MEASRETGLHFFCMITEINSNPISKIRGYLELNIKKD